MGESLRIATLLMVLPTGLFAETLLERMLGDVVEWSEETAVLEEGRETYSDLDVSIGNLDASLAQLEIHERPDGGMNLVLSDLVVEWPTEVEHGNSVIRLSLPSANLEMDGSIGLGPNGGWNPCAAGLVSVSATETGISTGTGFSPSVETGPITAIVDGTRGCHVLAETAELRLDMMGVSMATAELAFEMFQDDEAGHLSSRMALNEVAILIMGMEALRIGSVGIEMSFDDGEERWTEDMGMVLGELSAGLWAAILDDTSNMEIHVRDARPIGGLLETLLNTSLAAEGRQADVVLRAGQDAEDVSLGIDIRAPGLVSAAADLGMRLDPPSGNGTFEEVMEGMPFRLLSIELELELHDQGLSAVWEEEKGEELAGTLLEMAEALLPEGQAMAVNRWIAASRKGMVGVTAHPDEPIGLDEIFMMATAGNFIDLVERLGISATGPLE